VLERRLLEAQLVLFNPLTWNTTAISDYRKALEQLVGPEKASAPRLLRILLAESMMNESPWRYYEDEGKDSQTRTMSTLLPDAAKAFGLLYDVVFGSEPGATVKEEYPHPLALHLLIHLCEPSNEMAASPGLRVANLLSQAMNGSFTGHLVHMPAHIYTRLGLYSKSIESSQAAVNIDRQYVASCLSPYVPSHNIALLVMAALYSGEEKIARQYAPGLVMISQEPELGLPAMEARAKYLTAVFPVPLEFVLTRFGRWTELKDLVAETEKPVERYPTLPDVDISAGELRLTLRDRALIQRPFHVLNEKKPAFFLAMQQYVRSLQMIHQDHPQLDTAIAVMNQAANLIPHDELPTNHVFYPNHFEIGQIMNATVQGAGLIRRKRFQEAVEILEAAADLQESFLYMEPENWHVPIRHCVAAANLAWAASLNKSSCSETKVKALEAAIQALEYDLLHHHLHDVWALNGLALANKGLNECHHPGSTNVRASSRNPLSPCCEVAGCR